MVPNLIPISLTTPPAPGRLCPRILSASLLLAAILVFSPGASAEKDTPIRGVTISTHTDGSDWGSPVLHPTMKDIQSIGANWVCIHPYGWLGKDGRIRFHGFDPRNPPDYLANPIRYAHQLGLKILIKPHLGYWGSGFSWRGAIRFDTQGEWDNFFADYKAWIALLAAGSQEADGFVVGTELDSTLVHPEKWREVIQEVRKNTDVPLTYAANWTHFRDVEFWDALDIIGIQAYFPITIGKDPDMETLAAGWSKLMPELGDFARENNRKIVFTELGYTRSHSASIHPMGFASGWKRSRKESGSVSKSCPSGRRTGTCHRWCIFVEVVSKALFGGKKFSACHPVFDGSNRPNLAARVPAF